MAAHLRGTVPMEHLLFLPSLRTATAAAGDTNNISDGGEKAVAPPRPSPSGGAVPLLVFLHGAGEVDTSLDYLHNAEGATGALPQLAMLTPASAAAQSAEDPFRWAAAFEPHLRHDFAVLAPLSRHSWSSAKDRAATVALIDDVLAAYPTTIDPERVIITGVSQGGYGALRVAYEAPERFAGVAPVCGYGDAAWAARLVAARVSAFFVHGANDRVVPVSASDAVVEAWKAAVAASADGPAPLTYARLPKSADPIGYPGTGHAAWRNAYTDSSFWAWAAAVRRAAPPRAAPPRAAPAAADV